MLSDELRTFVKNSVLESGGHFSSNLGVIELTVALHHVLNLPDDAIVWDVGHQAYPHKVLTGRKDQLGSIRTFKGISGFPKREESIFDAFGTGHSSTAISAAMGMAAASNILSPIANKATFVAVVGDGALTAGLSYEALNNLFDSNLNVLVVLNDNQIGIDPNTGALNTQLQSNPEKVKPYFEWFGLAYSGPINGHDLQALIPTLQQAYQTKGPRMLHIKTTKGKGHPAAEKEQTKWHSAAKFVKIEPASTPSKKWQDVFGELLVVLAKKHPNLAGITPAMPSSCGMIHAMNQFPNRFFDVGIAEQHALTFAAGMATQGLIPVVNIYSSFLQRGYDQYIHDIALQNLPVILCVDRAGLVGEDGPTHHGAFDMAFMGCIPNTTLVAPRNAQELAAAMQWGINLKAPIAIRYPKGNLSESQWTDQAFENPEKTLITQYLHKIRESDILILSTGHASNLVQLAHNHLHHTPFDHLHCPIYSQTNQLLLSGNLSLSQYKHIITVEDGCIQGGWGQSMCQTLNQLYDVTITHLGIPNDFIEHGNNEEDLYPLCGYSPRDIAQTVIKFQRNG
jgi:1-deoxy-D-xylulose-5-phosphate synthase